MLEALKRLHGGTIHLPNRPKDFPDRDRLALAAIDNTIAMMVSLAPCPCPNCPNRPALVIKALRLLRFFVGH